MACNRQHRKLRTEHHKPLRNGGYGGELSCPVSTSGNRPITV